MVSIRTEVLRAQAEGFSRAARRYEYYLPVLEEGIAWGKCQEHREIAEAVRCLERLCGELVQQKKELALLEAAMQKICDKYDRAEQRILDSQEIPQKPAAVIGRVNVEYLQALLSELDIHVTE